VIGQHEIAVEPLTLIHGASRCEVLPQIGGSIGAWSVDGQHMLRAAGGASIAARNPLGMGSFPLVPYSNRIANGAFEWAGSKIQLQQNFLPEPHSIHGVGFQRPWQVLSSSGESALLRLMHQPDASWPWAFEAQQRITLSDGQLSLNLCAMNSAPVPVPLAFGHHPYFPQHEAYLSFAARAVWLVGQDGLPALQVKPSGKFDFSSPAPVQRSAMDHCFIGWNGAARITWPTQRWELEISASPTLQSAVLYVRDGADAFCFEPVPHMNNALNMRGHQPAIPVVAPGEHFLATVNFSAVAR
jgi:aldose 1-epimerase